jgi:hypothetical protein
LCDDVTVFRRSVSLIPLLIACALTQPVAGSARFTSYAEVRDILTALAEVLPPALKSAHGRSSPAAWSSWIANHDRAIRQRLQRGDADTIVNWLLFGTTFTSRPRALVDSPVPSKDAGQLAQLISARAADLVTALARAGQDERRLFARTFVERAGYRLQTPDDRARLEQHLVSEVARVIAEQAGHAGELEAVRQLRDASEQFAGRSKLFRERGLSLDTSIPPGFALEQTLRQMLAGGFVNPASIRRVAVIGPGLDFTDKAAGFDFYPQQTLQPFALIDTLRRLNLIGSPADVRITTLDISPRVNDHLLRARTAAGRGSPYMVQLPLDFRIPWKADVVAYWKQAGGQIGVVTGGTKPPSMVARLEVRAVSIRPEIVLQIVPEDLDIVAQRLDGPPFDLIVATNVFVYYDTLDQSLALANVEAMLKPGGILLSNNALLELPASRMRSRGYVTAEYSDRPDDGDHVVWYQRTP